MTDHEEFRSDRSFTRVNVLLDDDL